MKSGENKDTRPPKPAVYRTFADQSPLAMVPSVNDPESMNRVPPIFIPNAFTPNQDGVNNQFEFYGFPEPVKLTVFDRWGNIVFSSPNYQNNWDGTFNGKTLPLGSYTYLIEYIYVNPQSNNINVNGSKRNLRGIINIIP